MNNYEVKSNTNAFQINFANLYTILSTTHDETQFTRTLAKIPGLLSAFLKENENAKLLDSNGLLQLRKNLIQFSRYHKMSPLIQTIDQIYCSFLDDTHTSDERSITNTIDLSQFSDSVRPTIKEILQSIERNQPKSNRSLKNLLTVKRDQLASLIHYDDALALHLFRFLNKELVNPQLIDSCLNLFENFYPLHQKLDATTTQQDEKVLLSLLSTLKLAQTEEDVIRLSLAVLRVPNKEIADYFTFTHYCLEKGHGATDTFGDQIKIYESYRSLPYESRQKVAHHLSQLTRDPLSSFEIIHLIENLNTLLANENQLNDLLKLLGKLKCDPIQLLVSFNLNETNVATLMQLIELTMPTIKKWTNSLTVVSILSQLSEIPADKRAIFHLVAPLLKNISNVELPTRAVPLSGDGFSPLYDTQLTVRLSCTPYAFLYPLNIFLLALEIPLGLQERIFLTAGPAIAKMKNLTFRTQVFNSLIKLQGVNPSIARFLGESMHHLAEENEEAFAACLYRLLWSIQNPSKKQVDDLKSLLIDLTEVWPSLMQLSRGENIADIFSFIKDLPKENRKDLLNQSLKQFSKENREEINLYAYLSIALQTTEAEFKLALPLIKTKNLNLIESFSGILRCYAEQEKKETFFSSLVELYALMPTSFTLPLEFDTYDDIFKDIAPSQLKAAFESIRSIIFSSDSPSQIFLLLHTINLIPVEQRSSIRMKIKALYDDIESLVLHKDIYRSIERFSEAERKDLIEKNAFLFSLKQSTLIKISLLRLSAALPQKFRGAILHEMTDHFLRVLEQYSEIIYETYFEDLDFTLKIFKDLPSDQQTPALLHELISTSFESTLSLINSQQGSPDSFDFIPSVFIQPILEIIPYTERGPVLLVLCSHLKQALLNQGLHNLIQGTKQIVKFLDLFKNDVWDDHHVESAIHDLPLFSVYKTLSLIDPDQRVKHLKTVETIKKAGKITETFLSTLYNVNLTDRADFLLVMHQKLKDEVFWDPYCRVIGSFPKIYWSDEDLQAKIRQIF